MITKSPDQIAEEHYYHKFKDADYGVQQLKKDILKYGNACWTGGFAFGIIASIIAYCLAFHLI